MQTIDLVSRLLYRDALVLIVDKPPGIAVHRGPKGGDDLERHFDQLRFGLPRLPALAHRLDRDTSGCLVLGRHRKALSRLGQLFKTGRVGKTYWAVTRGGPDEDAGTIDLPLGRRDASRGWWMAVDASGAPSRTDWRVLGRAADETWLELTPLTGRTHQLRVHCAAMGWPIKHDPIYGVEPAIPSTPLHLLSRRIAIPLYASKEPIIAEAGVPAHMRAALDRCGAADHG